MADRPVRDLLASALLERFRQNRSLVCSGILSLKPPARGVVSMKVPAVVCGCVLLAGCGGSAAPSASAPVQPYEAELRLCVELTNEYRAGVGLRALSRDPRLEAYAADAARNDGTAHAPHQHFERTRGGRVALAENLIPWWSLSRYGSVRAIVQRGLAGMWAEGEGGGHHRNMTGPYSRLGCGVFVNRDEVTVVQAFR